MAGIAAALVACGAPAPEGDRVPSQEAVREGQSAVPDTTIMAAQEALTPTVMGLPGVVGTAIGLCGEEPCIKVYLARADTTLVEQIPKTFRGFLVDTEVTGEIRPLDTLP